MPTGDVKARIEAAATALIREHGGDVEAVTMRGIAGRAEVGVGLINYHYGSKEKLLRLCVQRIIHEVITSFRPVIVPGESPAARLSRTANAVMDFLLENPEVSRISILGDLHSPQPGDNTAKTTGGFLAVLGEHPLPLEERRRRAALLTHAMQLAFLRRSLSPQLWGFDFDDAEQRRAWIGALVALYFGEL